MQSHALPRQLLCLSICMAVCRCMTYETFDLPSDRTWTVGTFRNNVTLPRDNSLPRGNMFVFDKDCNVTIVFHEIYRDLEVALCPQVEQMKANIRTLPRTNKRTRRYFDEHCTPFSPRQSPVIMNYEAPVLLVVWANGSAAHVKDRNHLSDDPGLTFNATYELRLKSKSGLPSHINASVVDRHTPCESNGIPVLVFRNDSYEYQCDCKYSTTGANCEFGPLCPANKQRELCSFRGNCKQQGETKTCICDSEDFHGVNCIDYKFVAFHNCCGSQNESCCHRMPTRFRCSCSVGFIPSTNGRCVKDEQYHANVTNKQYEELPNRSIIRSITSSRKGDILEMCCFSCLSNVSFVFYKDNHVINEVPAIIISNSSNVTVWKRGDMEIKPSDPITLEPAMCLHINNYSEDDFGLYGCNVVDGDFNETQEHHLLNDMKVMEILPQQLTVIKGANASLKCRIRGIPIFEYDFNFNWTVLPLRSFESSSHEPHFFQASNIHIRNIQGDLEVECFATGVTENLLSNIILKTTNIKVVSGVGKYCGKENINGISWDIAMTGERQEALCPMYYNGMCFRTCYVNKNDEAKWDLDDCSECRSYHLLDIFRSVRLYGKGIESYGKYSSDVLPQLMAYLNSPNTIVHGELGYAVKRLQETISIPQFNGSFEDFNNVINRFGEHKHSIRDIDMFELEELIRMSGNKWKYETCTHRYYNGSNIVSYTMKPIEGGRRHYSTAFKLFPMPDIPDSKYKLIQADEVTISVDVTNGFQADVLTLTLFKKPMNFIPFMKTVQNNSWPFPSTGYGASALLQIEAYTENRSQVSVDDINHSIEFDSCLMSRERGSPWAIGCARYLPRVGSWTASDCKLTFFTDGRCSCSCSGSQGWTGLVRYKMENYKKGVYKENNIGTICASAVSLGLLMATTICLLYNLYMKKKECFSRIVEVLSIHIVNLIFLYQSLSEPRESDNLLMLITISTFMVLSLGVAVSHHLSTMQKCSVRNPLMDNEIYEPSLLVVVLSFISSTMLGLILWTISKVQQTKITSPWLPSSDTSILPIVVLCYLYVLAFLLVAIAACNYIKIRRMLINEPRNRDEFMFMMSIQVEFRNKCILNVVHLAFIFSSFYREKPVGGWLFSVIIVIQSVSLFLFYTSDVLWSRRPSLCGPICCASRTSNLPFSLRNCWNQICTPYSGVAKAEDADAGERVNASGENCSEVNVTSDISNIHGQPLPENGASLTSGGGACCSFTVDKRARGPAFRPQVGQSVFRQNTNYLVLGAADLGTGQYELRHMPIGEGSRHNGSIQHRHDRIGSTDGVTSLDRNSNRSHATAGGRGGKAGLDASAEKSLLRMSSAPSKSENFAHFKLRSRGLLSRVSSKVSLPGCRSKRFERMDESCWRMASSETIDPMQHPRNNTSNGMVNASQKQFPFKHRLDRMHLRQHSL